jgi:alkylation response protein AidB-like acyl-CoA dehydrogenase
MKFLSGIEQLQIEAEQTEQGWILNGHLPWVTNLHPDGFLVAVVAKTKQGAALFVVPSNSQGFTRNDDLDLISMRGSYTASASLNNVLLSDDYLLDRDAIHYLPKVRPVFLGLQCALAIGLIQKSLDVVTTNHRLNDAETAALIQTIGQQLGQLKHQLDAGLESQHFILQAQPLFRIKIELAALVQTAIHAELQTLGGKAYLTQYEQGFVRRLKESAFIPVVTPSIVQLKAELQKENNRYAS